MNTPLNPALRKFFNLLIVSDLLIIGGSLLLVFRWGKLGTDGMLLAAVLLGGGVLLLIVAIRGFIKSRKPPQSKPGQPWKPIEP